jgi:hypothetical protein
VNGDPGIELNEYPPDEEFFADIADAADEAYDPGTPDLVDNEDDDTPVKPKRMLL